MVAMVPRRFAPLVLGSLVVALVVLALGNFTGDGEGGAGPFIITVLATLVAAWLLWQFVVTPRVEGPRAAATTGIILGVLALLFGIVYWTGLSFAFGPAAIALGVLARERAPVERNATIAIVLGATGLALAVVTAIVDLAS